MEAWFVDHFADKKTYHGFLSYVGAFSDAFSLIYFQYRPDEAPSQTAREIGDALRPFLIYEQEVTRWPGTETKNEPGHVYRLRAYRRTPESLKVLEKANSLWDWNYPEFPMDLCFYRQGFSWFASSAHAHWNALYTDSPFVISDLKSIGLHLESSGSADDSALFFDERLMPDYTAQDNRKTDPFGHLLRILADLDKQGIRYRLSKVSTENDRLLIEAVVPGERWEIEIDGQSRVYFERFVSDGTMQSEDALYRAMAQFGDPSGLSP